MEEFLDIFKSISPNHVGMFARLFSAALLIQMLINFGEQLQYFKTRPTRIYGQPQKILGKFQLPTLSESRFIFFGVVLLVSLSLIVFGFFQRVFVLVALFCYFPYFRSILSLSYIQRKTNLIPFVLLVLAVSPALDQGLDHSSAGWEIVLIKIGLAQMYFSAGLQKIRHIGLNWMRGRSLQAYLLENYLWSDSRAGFFLAQKPMLCTALSIFTLTFELTFWVVIFVPELTLFYLALAMLFHVGILLTMRINYLKYLSPVYMVFLTDAAFWAKDRLGI